MFLGGLGVEILTWLVSLWVVLRLYLLLRFLIFLRMLVFVGLHLARFSDILR